MDFATILTYLLCTRKTNFSAQIVKVNAPLTDRGTLVQNSAVGLEVPLEKIPQFTTNLS